MTAVERAASAREIPSSSITSHTVDGARACGLLGFRRWLNGRPVGGGVHGARMDDWPFLGRQAVRDGLLTNYALSRQYRAIYRNVYLPNDAELTAAGRARAAWRGAAVKRRWLGSRPLRYWGPSGWTATRRPSSSDLTGTVHLASWRIRGRCRPGRFVSFAECEPPPRPEPHSTSVERGRAGMPFPSWMH